MADQAFPILQQEFTLKRAWFGVLNEQGTHLIGQAGFGVGLKRQLQEVQVELTRRHEFLDEALRTQQPVVVRRGSPMQCDGLQRVVEALKLDTIAIVPLVSLGQVVGVLIVEPSIPHSFVSEERLQLLSSMANEMATILMARRFESKMAEALKMRMAGLLASGVAHNFNNLLQAILGQVSLIELQLPKGAASLESTKTIAEAAKRGASLVSQLLSFATQNGPSKQITNLGKMITDSQELYRSLLGTRIELRCSVSQYCADATLVGVEVKMSSWLLITAATAGTAS
jgi:signal transduction histidine kinase